MDSGVTHGHPQPCSPQGHSLELLWVIPDRGSQALGRFWVLGIPGAVEGGTGWSLRTPKKVALDEFSDFGDLWEGERCHWRGLGTLGQWKVTLEGFWVLGTPKRVEGGTGGVLGFRDPWDSRRWHWMGFRDPGTLEGGTGGF